MIYIYALADPRDLVIRYVGKTTNLHKRVQRHLTLQSKCPHCSAWLAKMRSEGIWPEVTTLEILAGDADWAAAESRWIKHFRDSGNDLTNITDGGEGGATYGRLGKSNTAEHKAKCSAARKGRSIAQKDPEGKRRQSILDYYARCREQGIPIKKGPCSEERKRKIGAANRGRVLPMTKARSLAIEKQRGRSPVNMGVPMPQEAREKLSVARKGVPWSEARRAAQKQRTGDENFQP